VRTRTHEVAHEEDSIQPAAQLAPAETMARLLRALTLLVSVLSASAFAPSGWSGRPRTAPLKNGYLDVGG
jgi:hypothetical protein